MSPSPPYTKQNQNGMDGTRRLVFQQVETRSRDCSSATSVRLSAASCAPRSSHSSTSEQSTTTEVSSLPSRFERGGRLLARAPRPTRPRPPRSSCSSVGLRAMSRKLLCKQRTDAEAACPVSWSRRHVEYIRQTLPDSNLSECGSGGWLLRLLPRLLLLPVLLLRTRLLLLLPRRGFCCCQGCQGCQGCCQGCCQGGCQGGCQGCCCCGQGCCCCQGEGCCRQGCQGCQGCEGCEGCCEGCCCEGCCCCGGGGGGGQCGGCGAAARHDACRARRGCNAARPGPALGSRSRRRADGSRAWPGGGGGRRAAREREPRHTERLVLLVLLVRRPSRRPAREARECVVLLVCWLDSVSSLARSPCLARWSSATALRRATWEG